MIFNLTLIQKVIHPNSVVQEQVLLLSALNTPDSIGSDLIWGPDHCGATTQRYHEGNNTSVQPPGATPAQAVSALSTRLVFHNTSTQPAVLSSVHDKHHWGNSPNVQSTAALWEDTALVRKPIKEF